MANKRQSGYKPGQKAPKSGQIQESGSKTEKTVTKGEPFPPTSKPGNTYKYVDVTKHKKNR
jgi:hypothetical protein